jgi:hypothetical protein
MKQKLILSIDSETPARAQKYCVEKNINPSELTEN